MVKNKLLIKIIKKSKYFNIKLYSLKLTFSKNISLILKNIYKSLGNQFISKIKS